MHYDMVRLAVIATGFFVIMLFAAAIPIIFFIVFFGRMNITATLAAAVLTVVPSFVFVLSIGYFTGRINHITLYALIIAVLFAGFMPVANAAHIFGGTYFANAPLALPAGASGEPGFLPSTNFLLMRGAYFTVGIGIFIISIRRKTLQEC
jgi:hypothetical protein